MTEKKPVAVEKKKVKSKTFQTFTKRFVFSIVFILILVFVVSVTAFAKLPGKYIGFSLYMIASSLILFEGIKNFTMSLWAKIIICLGPIFFFIYPLEIFKKEIISPETNYSVKGLLELFFDWKILIIPAFIGIVVFFDKKFLGQKNRILNFLIIVVVEVMISVFFKFFWLMNMYQVYFTIFIFCLPAVVDIFSYISGIALSNPSIKKIKLAPDISPNKTFIGFLVGFIAGFFYFFLIAHFTKILPEISEQLVIEIALSFLLPFFAIIGDLFFSLIKRHLGIKDFSKVLPGHGGFLDRIDSWIFVFLLLVITFTVL